MQRFRRVLIVNNSRNQVFFFYRTERFCSTHNRRNSNVKEKQKQEKEKLEGLCKKHERTCEDQIKKQEQTYFHVFREITRHCGGEIQ